MEKIIGTVPGKCRKKREKARLTLNNNPEISWHMKKSRRTYNGVHLNKKSNTQDVVEQSLTIFLYICNSCCLIYIRMTRVRNMGRILSAFLMLGISSMCGAQIYKYLGIEDGLSNRRIYRIQKDGRGYMWFLTQEGMDRYDGKRIRHYTLFLTAI